MSIDMTDKLLLNYHDAVIYASDLSLLECPTAWLNDACIHFYMTRLQHTRRQDGARDGSGVEQTDLFLDPAVISYLMHQCDEDDEDFADEISNLHHSWNLSTKSSKRIFVPINDQFNHSRTAFTRPGGGSHWSLLLWTITGNLATSSSVSNFYHFDSSCGYNNLAAIAVSQKLLKVLHIQSSSMNLQKLSASVKECRTPQQNNGYDCGVYLLGFADALSSIVDDCCQEEYEAAIQEYSTQVEFASLVRKKVVDDLRRLIK